MSVVRLIRLRRGFGHETVTRSDSQKGERGAAIGVAHGSGVWTLGAFDFSWAGITAGTAAAEV